MLEHHCAVHAGAVDRLTTDAYRPIVDRFEPLRMRSKVDFPQPDAPTSVTNSFSLTFSSMLASARTWSLLRPKYFDARRTHRQCGFDLRDGHRAHVVLGDHQHHLEERADEDDRDLRAFVDADPQHHERNERNRGHVADEVGERFEQRLHWAKCADQQAERQREHYGKRPAAHHAVDVEADVVGEPVVSPPAREPVQDGARAR